MRWFGSPDLFYLSTGMPSESVPAILGLGGSPEHVLGGAPPHAGDHAFDSLFTGLTLALRKVTEDIGRTEPPPAWAYINPLLLACDVARIVQFEGPRVSSQRFAFLAKTLAADKVEGAPIVLATPLYVALADRPPPD